MGGTCLNIPNLGGILHLVTSVVKYFWYIFVVQIYVEEVNDIFVDHIVSLLITNHNNKQHTMPPSSTPPCKIGSKSPGKEPRFPTEAPPKNKSKKGKSTRKTVEEKEGYLVFIPEVKEEDDVNTEKNTAGYLVFIPEVKEEDEVNTEKNKAPNFHSDEDELLAIAWVSATENPIAGVGQKAGTFWADVHQKYLKLQERSTSTETKYPRTWNQLKGRFLRHFQVNVSLFNKYFNRAKENIPSGNASTFDAIMERAMDDF
jgi:predicted RNA-binding protein with TRAM domain